MYDYSKAKIYKISSIHTEKVYVGSTTKKYLLTRLGQHEYTYNYYLSGKITTYTTSYDILKLGDYQIELIEDYPCATKRELLLRERHWFDQLDCVNKARPVVNAQEVKQLRHDRYEENKDERLAKMALYRAKNNAKIKEHKNGVHMCECGMEYTQANKTRHERTNFHIQNTQ